jgi:hypothetical protein
MPPPSASSGIYLGLNGFFIRIYSQKLYCGYYTNISGGFPVLLEKLGLFPQLFGSIIAKMYLVTEENDLC